jgi:hypothetical protein
MVAGPSAHAAVTVIPLAANPDEWDPASAFQVGNLDFWVASCSISDASKGLSNASCGGQGLQLVGTSTNPENASVTIESATPGGHIFNIGPSQLPVGTDTYDLSLQMDVTTVACADSGFSDCPSVIKSDAISLTGSATNPGDDQYVTAGESISLGSGNPVPELQASLANPSDEAKFSPAEQYLIAQKDIGDQLSHITGPVTIDRVTQSFGVVPEPASVGVFLVSLVALGATRRRNNRTSSLS